MKIDPSTILVLALTLVAGVFLIWLELHSRRNSQMQQAEMPPETDGAAEAATPLVRPAEGAARKRRRHRR